MSHFDIRIRSSGFLVGWATDYDDAVQAAALYEDGLDAGMLVISDCDLKDHAPLIDAADPALQMPMYPTCGKCGRRMSIIRLGPTCGPCLSARALTRQRAAVMVAKPPPEEEREDGISSTATGGS